MWWLSVAVLLVPLLLPGYAASLYSLIDWPMKILETKGTQTVLRRIYDPYFPFKCPFLTHRESWEFRLNNWRTLLTCPFAKFPLSDNFRGSFCHRVCIYFELTEKFHTKSALFFDVHDCTKSLTYVPTMFPRLSASWHRLFWKDAINWSRSKFLVHKTPPLNRIQRHVIIGHTFTLCFPKIPF